MADAELKPCPFCGGAVELERTTGSYEKMHGQREWWGVVCRNTINVGGTCAIQQVPSASKEAAVERWNCRATHPTEAGAPTAPASDMRLVPAQPTREMLIAMGKAVWIRHPADQQMHHVYAAMLAAAPTSGRESAAPAAAGFTTAPIYPTKEMIEAAENTGDLYRMGSPNLWADVWCNMLRAAPAAPVRERDRGQDAKGGA